MVQQDTQTEIAKRSFDEEQNKLDDMVRYMTARIQRLEGRGPATAAYQETANALQAMFQEEIEALRAALDKPYFGRVDYLRQHTEDSDIDLDTTNLDESQDRTYTVYIGDAQIMNTDVVSWTAPVAKLWYSQSSEDGYTAPRGHIPTIVDLKRYLRIRERRIEYLQNTFQRMLPASSATRHTVLTEALSGTGGDDGHLQVIIETIEPDQYENIANVSDKVLIVQGAAGSGKSEIGLHRIAYLLSPHNDIPERERPTPSTTLFVGPSQAFLEYAADILPSLGIQEKVDQVKFSDWLSSQLSERVRVTPRIWNDLLNGGEMRRFSRLAETFKGSLIMADTIERHLSAIVREARSRCLELPAILGPIGEVRVSKGQIRSVVNDVFDSGVGGRYLNYMRERFVSRITGIAWSKAQSRRNLGRAELEKQRSHLRDSIVTPWCDEAWPHIDFRTEYVSLLKNSFTMKRLSKNQLSDEDAEALAESVRGLENHGFDDSDIGALAYLDHLLNGTIQNTYRHIVVDEAQDISPIEFMALAASSTNNWFTVLGDTAQRLTPYRGIRRWRDLERVFGRSEIAVQRARRSYRSNVHITRFNNRILRTFDTNIDAPIPFERDGHRVEFSRHQTAADMYASVISDIGRIRLMDELENAVLAILVRDRANLNRFNRLCEQRGISGIDLIAQEHHSNAKTVLGRIPDVKGLEYDAVIVMGVNESFSDTVFNKKLLYLATTRAKHYLGIHWSGRQSPILRSISDRGVVRRR